ncbi:MAG: ABC transporter ATP-binding protein [Acidobacteriota bacterium]
MELTNIIDELLTGIKHIFIFRVTSHWLRRFDLSSTAQIDSQIKQRLVSGIPKNTLELGIMTMFFGVTLVFRLVDPESLIQYLPVMGLIGMALMKLLQSLQITSRSRLKLMNQLPELEQVHHLLTAPFPEVRFGTRVFTYFNQSVTFDDVYFSYSNGREILRGINVAFNKNQITGIVGGSGEGKTTLINLLVGLYQPQRGHIQIDGVHLREYDIEMWRAKIGFVGQDPFIFNGTVAENIAFGEQSFTREEIVEAARVANAQEFIQQLPDGYDTVVGDRGMKLSGGEQQRISIARAILRKPEILVFDEATSSLDNIAERLVREAITRISRNRTVILVAHRLSTVQNADKIVVLHEGTCVEQGTHEQLMCSNGIYSSQVRAQAL